MSFRERFSNVCKFRKLHVEFCAGRLNRRNARCNVGELFQNGVNCNVIRFPVDGLPTRTPKRNPFAKSLVFMLMQCDL